MNNEFLTVKAKAEKGDATAQFNLGLMYMNDLGVEKDYAEAVKWYRKSAEQGNANAQNILGIMYEKGNGVEKDYVEALKWYNKAADQGLAAAQNILGIMYEKGNGVEKDYVEALKWYNKAAFSNLMLLSQWKGPQRPELSETEPDAAKNAADLKKLMSPQQVGEAQKRTKELKALIEAKNKSQ